MMRSLLVAAALLAACNKSSTPERTSKVQAPSDAAAAGADAATTASTTMKTELDLPDSKWTAAAEVALAAWKPWTEEQHVQRFVMKPLTAPDGATVPYLIAIEAFTDGAAPLHRGRTLVAGGKVVQGGGAEAASAYLRGLGFPATPIQPGLLVEILEIFQVVDLEWATLPSLAGWPALDDASGPLRRKPVEYARTGDGATLTFYRASRGPGVPADARQLADRLEIRFGADAAITTATARENADGSWTPN